MCASGGVQSQTITVLRQMKRYEVPFVIFVNKLDRMGANPARCLDGLRQKLGLTCAFVYLPIGLEKDLEGGDFSRKLTFLSFYERYQNFQISNEFFPISPRKPPQKGIVDIINNRALYFKGPGGTEVEERPIPADLQELRDEKFDELIGTLADVDDEIAEQYLMEEVPSIEEIEAAIRRGVINRSFQPVLMGSALKNTGVQCVLDKIVEWLPRPDEVDNFANRNLKDDETEKLLMNPGKLEVFNKMLTNKHRKNKIKPTHYARFQTRKVTIWSVNMVSNVSRTFIKGTINGEYQNGCQYEN